MCFVLYVGTEGPLPLNEWKKESPCVHVESLDEKNRIVIDHFSKPFVHYLGSTSGCGCNFPFWMADQGEPDLTFESRQPEQIAIECKNAEELADLLRNSSETSVELYGVWSGDESVAPREREDVSLKKIVEPSFCFREQVFYNVSIP